MDVSDFLFGREKEIAELEERISTRKSFILHGPSGAGKTFLVRRVISALPRVLYCPDSSTGQSVFRHLAFALSSVRDPHLRRSIRNTAAIQRRSTISLRGIGVEALRSGNYWVVLDHLRAPAAGLSSDVRHIMFCAETPVLAVARSPHMEDMGFLAPMFVLRSERLELRNFCRLDALRFAEAVAMRSHLTALNLPEFLEKIVELSYGLPGAMVAMIEMAKLPKYRTGGHIKVSPLYIDSRLAWHAANAW
jgi:hypothetical protein